MFAYLTVLLITVASQLMLIIYSFKSYGWVAKRDQRSLYLYYVSQYIDIVTGVIITASIISTLLVFTKKRDMTHSKYADPLLLEDSIEQEIL